MRYLIFSILMLCLFAKGSLAQEDYDDIVKNLIKAYRNPAGLNFEIAYRYSHEELTGKYIDSVKGKYMSEGKNTFFEIENTVSIRNSQYSIAVFEEDKIIYVGKAEHANEFRDPMSNINGLLTKDSNIGYKVESLPELWQIELTFPSNASYKRLTYLIDKKTYLLTRTIATIKNSVLYMSLDEAPKGTTGEYSTIETTFKHFENNKQAADVFSSDSYFTKDRGEFVPSGKYTSYKIVKASPNL